MHSLFALQDYYAHILIINPAECLLYVNSFICLLNIINAKVSFTSLLKKKCYKILLYTIHWKPKINNRVPFILKRSQLQGMIKILFCNRNK